MANQHSLMIFFIIVS